ncbi:MAG: CPBP family intramembrane metalloprotease [Anaerolineales bacterium]|nr:CPBP family intramembrane metalloprotease [Anaerolineales bacterium]
MRILFGEKLHLDWKIAILTIVSTLVLMVDYYHYPLLPWTKWFSSWDATGLSMKVLDRTLLYFIIPMFFILVVFRENPKDYGFTFGDWKAGIVITLGAIIFIAPILWLVGRSDASMQNYYKPMVAGLPWSTLLDLFGWEFIFRGWLLFGYARKFGPEALWLQAVPFALAHMGKPELETLSTIFGGFAFGWVAWRTKSFVYPLLIHWFVASFTIVVAAGVLG